MKKEHTADKEEDALEYKMGNMELREDKPPLTLLTIDDDSLKSILEHVDFKSIMTLRKVCRPLRNFLIKESSNINLERLVVQADSPTRIVVYSSSQKIVYRNEEDRCAVLLYEGQQGNPTICRKIDRGYCEAFLNDFKIILDHQKSALQFFEIELREPSTEDQILNELLEYFHLRSSKLKVEHVEFSYNDGLLSMIPFFQPVTLSKIEVVWFDEELDYDRLLELEQWRHAKSVNSTTVLTSFPLNLFTRFQSIEIRRRVITLEEIKFLKETFFSNHTIEKFSIWVENLKDNKQQIFDSLGPMSSNRSYTCDKVWVFRIPETDQFLEIRIFNHFTPCVMFSRKEASQITNFIVR